MDTAHDTRPAEGREACCSTSVWHSGRVHGSLTLVLILLAAFLFAQTINALKTYRYIGGGVSPSNVISVSGEGEVFAVPDTAEFVFTIYEEAATAKEVQDTATAKANDAIEGLKAEGVAETDIKTVNYTLQPKYEWEPATCLRFPCDRTRVQRGFVLEQSVRVKVRDLDKAGAMLELAASKEVSSVGSLSFTIADEDSLKAEARKAAIDEAKEKAAKLAEDLGVSVVRIVGYNEDSYYPGPVIMRAAFAEDEALGIGGGAVDTAPAVPAGENRIVSNVNITFEIR